MDREEQKLDLPEEKQEYRPRPAWQVWAARVALVIMIISIALYYLHIATGGWL